MGKSLEFKTKNIWEEVGKAEKEKIFEMGEDYKNFLDNSKTERWTSREIVRRAEAEGFKNMEDLLKEGVNLKPGDKVYKVNNEKNVALFVVGKKDLIEGMNIIGSHIDSPRLDLKQIPLYEKADMAYLKTHYYGGIKKYQWVASPLELHGVVMNKNGEKIDIKIGDEETDPVMYITDLLPHLAQDQMGKKAGSFIEGEGLNILIGSIPGEDGDNRVKTNVLEILNKKYGIEEEDFVSAELEVVPAGKSRDVGLDRSMIMGYGHDDRVCAYTSLEAILNIEEPERTALAFFADKEEIGSTGNTGMEAIFLENAVQDLVYLMDEDYKTYKVKKALENSFALSADVAAAFDPEFPNVYELNNTAKMNNGITMVKYTGVRGKSGSSDANAEFVSHVRNVFNKNDIIWQTGELGKVDQGGGGTIAYIMARHGMEVLDAGVPVLSMHATYEVVSKADVYMTYKGYKAFYKA